MLAERKRAALFVALVFLCGVLAGAVGMNLWQQVSATADSLPPTASGQQTASRAAPSSPTRRRAVEWFTKKLDLRPDQVTKLTQIIEETRSAYRQHQAEIKSIQAQGYARIREILDEGQKARFDQLLASRAEEAQRKNR